MNATSIVKEPTRYKSLSNPSSIHLVITISFSSFQNTMAISTGLSDFHKMVITVLKQNVQRSTPKELAYREQKTLIDLHSKVIVDCIFYLIVGFIH